MAKHLSQEEPVRRPRRRGPGGFARFVRGLVLDILLTGLILVLFALPHHVLPRLTANLSRDTAPAVTATPRPAPTATAVPEETAATAGTDAAAVTPEPTPEATPDPRTPWQIKFADKFTDEIIQTENSYSSPNVSITITTESGDINGFYSTWYVADIYIAQIENFVTEVAFNGWERFSDQDIVELDAQYNALLAMNGDFCTNDQSNGFYVRNGITYKSGQTTQDICVLYYDGTMETYGANEYNMEDILARDPYQVWKWGPELLDENAQPIARENYNTTDPIKWENPRAGIGYYEPGHYCFIVVAGRIDGFSRGVWIDEFAQIFADLGCVAAYNMDGGASAVMSFNDAQYTRQSSYRKVGDILVIKELEPAAAGTEEVG